MEFRFPVNNRRVECCTYILGLKLYFKLESGVKIELNTVKMSQSVDFRVKMALNTVKTA